jgi:hypothetical protein
MTHNPGEPEGEQKYNQKNLYAEGSLKTNKTKDENEILLFYVVKTRVIQ